jgi:LacI family transcriptional regulator, galactose operon repressor
MAPTIKDVAKKANVSTATVSLVIHNNKRISNNTRKKVQKAISELKYYPSRMARGLVLKQTHNIGFLLTHDHFLRTEPFYTHIFLGTEFEARDHEYYILLNTVPNNPEECDKLPRFVLENNVDGIIIAGKVPTEIITCLESYNFPLIFVDYYPPKGDYSAVLIDNLNGAIQATEHLINYNHQYIGFIGGDITHPSIRDRFQGYKIALDNNNLKFESRFAVITESSTSRTNGYHAAGQLLDSYPELTAIFASNDAMAIGAMQYIKERGRKIPKDISVIGFDDVNADLFTDPPLSSMKVPKVELGAESMRLMLEILKNNIKKSKKIMIPVELVARESTMGIN